MGIQLKSVKVKALKDFTYGSGLKTVGQVFNAPEGDALKMQQAKRVEIITADMVKAGKAKKDVVPV
jgi:hypothetical protein